jgi:hypothetical protein
MYSYEFPPLKSDDSRIFRDELTNTLIEIGSKYQWFICTTDPLTLNVPLCVNFLVSRIDKGLGLRNSLSSALSLEPRVRNPTTDGSITQFERLPIYGQVFGNIESESRSMGRAATSSSFRKTPHIHSLLMVEFCALLATPARITCRSFYRSRQKSQTHKVALRFLNWVKKPASYFNLDRSIAKR